MSESQSTQRVLALAKEREKKYEWLDAIEFHKKALGQVLKQKDFLKAGDIQERIGHCLHRAGFQAENQEAFRKKMELAIEAYEKARGFYEELGDEQEARMFRCKAIVKYLGYWLTSVPSEKRKFLDECIELEGKSLALFFDSEDLLEYGRTYNELSQVFFQRAVLEWDRRILSSIIERGIEWGQKAGKLLTELGDSYEIARAFLALGTVYMCDLFGFYFIAEREKQEQHRSKVVEHMRSAIEFSEKVGDAYVKGFSFGWLGLCSGGEESTRYYQKSIDCGKETRDNYLYGFALNLLAYITYWEAFTTEDPEQRMNLAEKAMKVYDKAQHHFSVLSYQSPRWGLLAAPGGHAEHYLYLGEWETDPEKKMDFLMMAEKSGVEALKAAEDSDIPLIIGTMLHVLGKILEARAKMESDFDVKRSLLEKALKHRERAIEVAKRITPYDYWDQGIELACLAGVNAELGELEQSLDSKKRLFEEAASNLERSLGLMAKAMQFYEKMGRLDLFASMYRCQNSYAILLIRLHELTGNLDYLRKTIEVSTRAIESASKLEMVSLIAESYWKIAKTEDDLGEYSRAAEHFKNASEAYMKASEKIPQLRTFYRDYAFYMQAWSQIEKAKHHHAKKQYGQAKEDYMKTAELHDSTERWNYLNPNYLAWAQLEEAENLSRREQSKEAKSIFQRAASLFVEAKKSIQAKLEKIDVTEEKTLAAELVKASDIRRKYCLGRIALEEAKILDRQGDHTESSKKYGSAAEVFQEIVKVESERSRKELQQIIVLCQAWQKMMMAEAKASSTMYGEAAELFKHAKEYTIDQPTSLLVLGHSSFSKALQAGTTFEVTRDMSTYLVAKNHMEAAENYYLKAGFKNASEYAKATYMLFDYYMYMHKAETETDPAKKAQYYKMAEKLLQASAGSYMKAKHPEKSEEVQRLLESVREKRQLAISLTEVVHAPTVTGTTTSFSTPTPTHEKAVGLERFEHTVVEAYLTASEEVTVEEQMEVRLDLVNVAKESGLLVRVDHLVPPSFKVTVPPSQYTIEDGSINMKGKKIGPIKVETVNLSLQAIESGVVNLNPQVIYVDDLGKFRTSKPDPVAITIHPKLAFEFKTKAAKNAFEFLTTSFVEDYMKRRLSLEKAGWRTLMDIVKHGKVSKSSVYGAGGRRGRAVAELERRGLVETRVFLGERGRGGKILKMRIAYDKETIKRHIDQKVMKIKEK